MIRLTTLENRFEADLITEALAEDHIEYVLKPFHDTAYDGLFEATKGFALLLVAEEDELRAKAIVDELRSAIGQGLLDETEMTDHLEEDEIENEDEDEDL